MFLYLHRYLMRYPNGLSFSRYESFRLHSKRLYETVYDSLMALHRQLRDFSHVKIYAYIEADKSFIYICIKTFYLYSHDFCGALNNFSKR